MTRSIYILFSFLLPQFAKSQTADFSFQSTTGILCNPSSIKFTQNCTGNPTGFVWDFGNNAKGYTGDIDVTYTTSGTFTVRLIAIYAQKTIEVSKTIVINPVVNTSIVYDKNYICKPGSIQFSALATGNITNYSWNFGDNSGLINTVLKDTAHLYPGYGTYQVSLKATDNNGCVGLANTTVQVIKPPIAASLTPTTGCIPAVVNFAANITVPVNDFVSNYSWNFGDGSPSTTGTLNNISHLYASVGIYIPTLSITTNDGCTNTYNYPAVLYGTLPLNHIAYPKKLIVCGSESPVFVSKAINANLYLWDYGDGTSAYVTDTLTQHKYNTLGIKTVSVTPFFNNCPGTTLSFQIEVTGVIASFTYANNCSDKKSYVFNNTSSGNLSAVLWNFGDNSANLSSVNATHSFPVPGQFITSLLVTDSISGCSDTFLQPVFTATPLLVNPDSSICRNANTFFSIQNSYTNSSTTYTWNVAGFVIGPIPNSSINIKASSLGNFNNFVSVNYGAQSCPDTIQLNHLLQVKGPDLNFTAPSSLCFNSLYTVVNSSKPYVAADSIKLWFWNFGNSILNDTVYQPAPLQYPNPGSYDVKLTGVDINGCKDSLTKNISINPYPFLRVVPQQDTICLGQSDTLATFSSDPFLWSPSNNISCVTCDTVNVNPVTTARYYVTSTTAFNCSVSDSVLIKVYTPFAAVPTSKTLYVCRDEQVKLDITPLMNRVVWNPAKDLDNANIYNPTASPSQTTTYVATLVDSAGCFNSTDSVLVIVKSLPLVNAGPDKIVPYNSAYSITPVYSNNVGSYFWTPSTLLDCNNCKSPNGIATYSQTYSIYVTSDSGCVASDNIYIFVECKNANILMPKAFTPNNDNLNDIYYPITRGVKSIKRFSVYNRLGKMMYEASNFQPNNKSLGWNGLFKGQYQPSAAYVYVLEAVCEIGSTIKKSGSFLLLR